MLVQLDLFEGVVLSEKQIELLTTFQTNNTRNVKIEHGKNINMVNALIEGGFIEGVDFTNTFDVIEVVKDIKLGYSHNNTLFTVNDVECIKSIGSLQLHSKKYFKDTNRVDDENIINLGFKNGKFECYGLTGNMRFIKASTLLTKLQERREKAEYEFKFANEKMNAFNKAISELQTKCPDARVLEVTETVKIGNRYTQVQKVKVQFENGSYVMFAVQVNNSTYSVDRKYDAGLAIMNADELLVNFTNQNK